ncbi:MAG: hypothetical protein K2P88_17670 [Chitinophagaceae bacterium]|nr:hypothetical protein [Chitinophagaceae bacterium]
MSFLKKLFGSNKSTPDPELTPITDKAQNAGINADIESVKSGKLKVYPILKPGDWIGIKAGAICQVLVGNAENPLLVIGFGYDAPQNFVFLNGTDFNTNEEIQVAISGAYQNLAAYEVALNEVVPGKVCIIDGKDFCAEKILDKPFMRALQNKLGGDHLMVSIPRRRGMMVTNSFDEEEIRAIFLDVHAKTWNDPSYGNAPIINAVFKLVNGEIELVKPLN